jgi:hypothetical protein
VLRLPPSYRLELSGNYRPFPLTGRMFPRLGAVASILGFPVQRGGR